MATDWTKFTPFYVGVPHQRRPFVVTALAAKSRMAPDIDAGDLHFYGDHDLSAVEIIDSPSAAETLMDPRDPGQPGGQARHQAIAIAILVRTELESQGVLEPDEENNEQED